MKTKKEQALDMLKQAEQAYRERRFFVARALYEKALKLLEDET